MKECFKLLKSLRGLQTLRIDGKAQNQNELITIKDITRDSQFLNSALISQGQGINNVVRKASLLVEVLWVYNFRRLEHDERKEFQKSNKPEAILKVADYTQNTLLGDSLFSTPYVTDFKDTALHINLWENTAIPFNKLKLVEGDILYLSNVSFKYSKQEFKESNSTRMIEGHIRGNTGDAEHSIQLVNKLGDFEKQFMQRRESYLRQNMYKAPARELRKFVGDNSRKAIGVPSIAMGMRDGQNILMITNKDFYDARRISRTQDQEDTKRNFESVESKQQEDDENSKKRVRRFPSVPVSPLGKLNH